MKKVFAATLLIAMSACGEGGGQRGEITWHMVTLTGKNEPKHFYVDLQESDGSRSTHVYVSKHCTDHRTGAVVGHQYQLPRQAIRGSEGSVTARWHRPSLYRIFCGG